MKKTILLTGLLISFSLLKAQDGKSTTTTTATTVQKSTGKKSNHNHTPEEKADKFTGKMTEAIGIDEAQKTKVRSLALDHFKKMDAIRNQANGDKEKIKTEGKNSRKIFNEGLKKVLTPEQFEAWKAKRKEANKQRKEAPKNEPVEMIED